MSSKQITTGVAVVVALAVAGYFLADSFFFTSSNQSIVPTQLGAAGAAGDSGLVVQDEVVGTGQEVQPGDTLVVQYTGKLSNGSVFDTSVGKPAIAISPCPAGVQTGLCMTFGAGQVIPGWEQGLAGMKVGGKRVLIIPPGLAYGSQDYGPIPGNSTLTFEVELLAVEPAGPAQ